MSWCGTNLVNEQQSNCVIANWDPLMDVQIELYALNRLTWED